MKKLWAHQPRARSRIRPEAPKVQDVAQDEADEGGGAEDVEGEQSSGRGGVLLHELHDGLFDLRQVEAECEGEDGAGDDELRRPRVVEDEWLLEVDIV